MTQTEVLLITPVVQSSDTRRVSDTTTRSIRMPDTIAYADTSTTGRVLWHRHSRNGWVEGVAEYPPSAGMETGGAHHKVYRVPTSV
ncbi:MAG: hypothetical protein LBK25_03930 [Treponema sp.]|nr:hypothetical protein [Treponema sp.]